MKSIVSYIFSFIFSVLLIFSFIASIAVTVANNFANPDKLYQITKEKNISHVVYTELEKYYSERYNTTGIPADIYMNAIDEEYIDNVIYSKINDCFFNSQESEKQEVFRLKNDALDTALSNFYSDYADSVNAPKDAKYDEKLSTEKANTYEVIMKYCDVFKTDAMYKHGVLVKLTALYETLPTLTLLIYGTMALFVLIVVLVNIKSISSALYWTGISALVSGIICTLPCLYLKFTNYFGAFTIKEPQIYTSYTSLMYGVIGNCLEISLILILVSIIFISIYALLVKNKKFSKALDKTQKS